MEDLIIAISVIVIACAFVVLVIFLVMMLLSLKKTVDTAERICRDVQLKVDAFDPYFRIISQLGATVEKKTESFVQHVETEKQEKMHKAEHLVNTAVEVTNWAMVGLAMLQRLKRRK